MVRGGSTSVTCFFSSLALGLNILYVKYFGYLGMTNSGLLSLIETVQELH